MTLSRRLFATSFNSEHPSRGRPTTSLNLGNNLWNSWTAIMSRSKRAKAARAALTRANDDEAANFAAAVRSGAVNPYAASASAVAAAAPVPTTSNPTPSSSRIESAMPVPLGASHHAAGPMAAFQVPMQMDNWEPPEAPSPGVRYFDRTEAPAPAQTTAMASSGSPWNNNPVFPAPWSQQSGYQGPPMNTTNAHATSHLHPLQQGSVHQWSTPSTFTSRDARQFERHDLPPLSIPVFHPDRYQMNLAKDRANRRFEYYDPSRSMYQNQQQVSVPVPGPLSNPHTSFPALPTQSPPHPSVPKPNALLDFLGWSTYARAQVSASKQSWLYDASASAPASGGGSDPSRSHARPQPQPHRPPPPPAPGGGGSQAKRPLWAIDPVPDPSPLNKRKKNKNKKNKNKKKNSATSEFEVPLQNFSGNASTPGGRRGGGGGEGGGAAQGPYRDQRDAQVKSNPNPGALNPIPETSAVRPPDSGPSTSAQGGPPDSGPSMISPNRPPDLRYSLPAAAPLDLPARPQTSGLQLNTFLQYIPFFSSQPSTSNLSPGPNPSDPPPTRPGMTRSQKRAMSTWQRQSQPQSQPPTNPRSKPKFPKTKRKNAFGDVKLAPTIALGEPTDEYLSNTLIPSRLSSSSEDVRPLPKLIILDMNKALVFRKSRDASGTKAAIPRPYLSTFLRYIFSSVDAAGGVDGKGKRRRRWAVMVWSSAQRMNAQIMSRSIQLFPPHSDPGPFQPANHDPHSQDRDVIPGLRSPANHADASTYTSTFASESGPSCNATGRPSIDVEADGGGGLSPTSVIAIWGRERLNLHPDDFHRRVVTTKDISQVWNDPEIRLMARRFMDVDGEGEGKDGGEGEGEGDVGWSAFDTVLIDDEVIKAKIQPFNHLPLPEFVPSAGQVDDMTGEDDTSLLRTIGALETLSRQTNVSNFIRMGGLKGLVDDHDGVETGSTSSNGSAMEVEGALLPSRLEGGLDVASSDAMVVDRPEAHGAEVARSPKDWEDLGRKVCGELGISIDRHFKTSWARKVK